MSLQHEYESHFSIYEICFEFLFTFDYFQFHAINTTVYNK